MGTFNVLQRIDVKDTCSNIDALYGPYETIPEALVAIKKNRRAIGRTVAIIENGKAAEYWWKEGIEDSDLVRKMESMILSLELIGESSFTKEEGEPITAQFRVDGGISVKKALLYQVIEGNERFVTEYGNIGKGSPYTFQIPNPTMSGVYTYRIKVMDALDNYAITSSNINYIEYTLSYGGLTAVYNLVNLDAITVKNYTSVSQQTFQINISVRDNTFTVNHVYLTDHTDEHSEPREAELFPDNNTSASSDDYLGNHTYTLPTSSTLELFNGKMLSVVIAYTSGEDARENVKELFRLLDIKTLELVPDYEGSDYYTTLPAYYVFTLKAAVENLSITLTTGTNSDFSFERTTVSAYRRYNLRVIPGRTAKENANIVIDYSYIYNNRPYTGSITRTIGNILALPEQSYYEPESGGPVSRETVVEAKSSDYTGIDDGQYYKIIPETVSKEKYSSSFILDTYCKINQQNDNTINYIKVTYGGVDIVKVTEAEIATQWGNLYTDTPLNEWTQIGIGINLEEYITRNNESVRGYYHCIYINGMVVKTVRIEEGVVSPLEYNSTSKLIVTVGNGLLVQKCFLYYKNNGATGGDVISPNTLLSESIIYNNYKSHKKGFEEPQNLPVLKFLRITNQTDSDRYFGLINAAKDGELKHTTIFGSIGDTKATDMNTYDPNYSSSTIFSNATLFRQSVDIKKPAQKEYAVLCYVEWQNSVMQDIIVEVHTQGTSTLVYSVPNFKFTFWEVYQESGEEKIRRYEPHFIEIEGTDPVQYYEESIYTAKADYMDSSHLNNTPTCTYYNALIKHLISEEAEIYGTTFTGSPSARNGMLDAILGFPIVMEISDNAESFSDTSFTNIGSFMLNIDKTGNSLGFEVTESGQQLHCISFEGTSNDNNSGASGRFDIPDVVTLPYGDGTQYVTLQDGLTEYETTSAIEAAYAAATDNSTGIKSMPVDQALLTFSYVQWCNFLSQGLEYRYPDSDIYKEKNGKVSKVMDLDHFKSLYRMWWWVYKSDTLSSSDYKSQFEDYFDLTYCMLYFINLMAYAQTDNLGKNAMFDSWGDGIWYPRPYDLDSEAGLDNNGNDNIAPFVEIRAPFSLNYDVSKENDYAWRAANWLIDERIIDPETGTELYPVSTIQYGTQTYDRYHFSSNKSKLWITFYQNYRTEINGFYSNLRTNYGYSPETIITLCKSLLIDKLGTAQYNKDFQNKYLANSDQRLAYGNRWYKFKKWITKRFAFCDSYFGATDSAIYNVTTSSNYTIKVDAPQYVAQRYQSSVDTRFVLDSVTFNTGSGGATKVTLLVNQPSVFETTLFKYVTLETGTKNYNNLISLDVSGNRSQGFSSITSVTGTSLDNLKYLNISNSAVQQLTVPPNLKTLVAEGVTLSTLSFPENCTVEEISLKGSTLTGAVSFSMLPNLKKLDLTDCKFSQDVEFEDLPVLSNLILTRANFSGDIIISNNVNVTYFDFSNLTINSIEFNGYDSQIDTVNFHNTTFVETGLNLDAIKKSVKNLYFDICKGLTHLEVTGEDGFESLQCLSLTGSSILSLGESTTAFDCSYFTGMGSLKKVASYADDGTVTYTGFTFQETKIPNITNINWTGSGYYLFSDCRYLTSITGTMSITTSMERMFFRCYLLSTLPTITVGSSVTTANRVFAGANSLSYNAVSAVIAACTNVSDFTDAFRCKQFATDQVISLDTLFGNNTCAALTLDGMFRKYNATNETYEATTNKIQITGKLPSSVTTAIESFYGLTLITVPYDILSEATSLTSTKGMFAASTVAFTGDGRPTRTDSYSESVTLSNAVTKSFFPTSLKNIAQMFYNSNVVTDDNTLFSELSVLQTTNATFGSSSVKRFEFVNSQGGKDPLPLNATNMWQSNPDITDISACFANIYNVSCSGLAFHSSVTASKTVKISGLFGLLNNTYRDASIISLNIDAIVPILNTDVTYALPHTNSYSSGPGAFQNRILEVVTASGATQALTKVSGNSQRLFKGTYMRLPSTVTSFNLSGMAGNCSNMFEECRLYTYKNSGSYGVLDRKFVTVTLPTSGTVFSGMFKNSSVLSDLPTLPSSTTDVSSMYEGCVINKNYLSLPNTYFATCASSLTNTSAMFKNNMYLMTLDYNATRGLFEGCTDLSNVASMFEGAYFLHKGIPVNFFGTTNLPKMTSLYRMFYKTTILYDVEDDSKKWINQSTLTPLINLDNVSEMFAYNNIYQQGNQFPSIYVSMPSSVKDATTDVATIAPNTFAIKSIYNISKLFKHTQINISASVGLISFNGFVLGTEAFFHSSIDAIDSTFVLSNNISAIVNADRMFYQKHNYEEGIENLATFVNSLVDYTTISKNNIAGNVVDASISADYTAGTTAGDADTYTGFSLIDPSDPEADGTDGYGHHIYA